MTSSRQQGEGPPIVLGLLVALAACTARPVEVPVVRESRPARAPEPELPAIVAAATAAEDRWLDLDIFQELDAGGGCAVERGGALWCWGEEPTLRAGARPRPGKGESRRAPTRVFGVQDARAVSLSRTLVCRIDGDGHVRCIGGTGRDWWEVAGVERAVDVVVTRDRGCARQADGELRCWQDRAPIRTLLDDVVAFDMEDSRGCALEADGTIACWTQWVQPRSPLEAPEPLVREPDARALAVDGQSLWIVDSAGLVRRRGVDHHFPDRAWTDIDQVPGAVEIAVGTAHVCVRTADDRALCRGRNSHGQLGDGTSRKSDRFVPVAGVRARGLALGKLHTCARTPEAVVCVGRDVAGSLAPPRTDDAPLQHTLPALVARALAAQGATTCAVDDGDVLRCWGSDLLSEYDVSSERELGVHAAAASVRVADGVRALRGLWSYAGNLYWVGDDDRLRVALRGFGAEPTFTAGSLAGKTDPERRIRRLAGVHEGPVCAIESHGSSDMLVCGSSPYRMQPLPGARGPVAIDVDHRSVCAIDRRGQVVCTPYELGASPELVPAVVRGLTRPRALATALETCALGADGRVRCWKGDVVDLPSADDIWRIAYRPQRLEDPGLADVAAIAASNDHFCSLDRAGAVRCWSPDDGKVWDEPPPRIAGEVVELVAGSHHFCARERDGQVTCWGDEDHGQLGRLPADVFLRPTPLRFGDPEG